MNHIIFIHSSFEGPLGCLPLLAVMNKPALNIVSLWNSGTSFVYISMSAIAESWGRTIPNFLRNHQINFQQFCTSFHSYKQWKSVNLVPHPCQHLLSLEFLILASLMVGRWNLRVILICISLMTKNIEHFFNCFSDSFPLVNGSVFMTMEFLLLYL